MEIPRALDPGNRFHLSQLTSRTCWRQPSKLSPWNQENGVGWGRTNLMTDLASSAVVWVHTGNSRLHDERPGYRTALVTGRTNRVVGHAVASLHHRHGIHLRQFFNRRRGRWRRKGRLDMPASGFCSTAQGSRKKRKESTPRDGSTHVSNNSEIQSGLRTGGVRFTTKPEISAKPAG